LIVFSFDDLSVIPRLVVGIGIHRPKGIPSLEASCNSRIVEE
jgi:hypothetical protein